MKKIIIGNWKMNPTSLSQVVKLAREIDKNIPTKRKLELVIAPPFPFLIPVREVLTKSKLGAQNSFWKEKGAYTGEVSPAMLKSVGVKYVILGHSERREHLYESDEIINKKIKTVLASGLKAIFCVGERDRAKEDFQLFVKNELSSGLKNIPVKFFRRIIIAYEPIWSIGTGKTVGPQDLYEMSIYIRRVLLDIFGKEAAHSIPVLYGGSVDSRNSRSFLEVDGINGLLVGGASTNAQEFIKIIKSAIIKN